MPAILGIEEECCLPGHFNERFLEVIRVVLLLHFPENTDIPPIEVLQQSSNGYQEKYQVGFSIRIGSFQRRCCPICIPLPGCLYQ